MITQREVIKHATLACCHFPPGPCLPSRLQTYHRAADCNKLFCLLTCYQAANLQPVKNLFVGMFCQKLLPIY